jgi:hypothetical protein
MGPTPLQVISRWMNKATGHFIPEWNPYLPRGASKLLPATASPGGGAAASAEAVRAGAGGGAGRPAAAPAVGRPPGALLPAPPRALGGTSPRAPLQPPSCHAPPPKQAPRAIPRRVVYLPACVTRMMGPSASDTETASVHEKLMSLFAKGGWVGRDPLFCFGLLSWAVAGWGFASGEGGR